MRTCEDQTKRPRVWSCANRLLYLSLTVALASVAGPLFAQADPRDVADPNAPPKLEVHTLVEGAGRLDWSTQGQRLAYDAPDESREDGLFDIFIVEDPLNGLGRGGRCLTCTVPDLRRVHAINPHFHPSGDTLIFTSVDFARKTGVGASELDTVTRSNRSELWLARSDGKDFWKLSDYAGIGGAVLDPWFSYEGSRLVWSERTNTRKGQSGAWRLRSGAIKVKRGVPRLSNLKVEFAPKQPALVIPHGFTQDESGFLISANLEDGQMPSGVDVYLVRDGAATRLTRTGGIAEHLARFHPEGRTITFVSAQRLRRDQTASGQPVRELWSMATDGTEQRRLTHFNEPWADEYRGATFVGDFDWHPAGTWMAAQVVSGSAGESSILLLSWADEPSDDD